MPGQQKSEQQNNRMSWRIHCIKEALGHEDIRNEILEKFIDTNIQQEGIIFGQTFGIENYKQCLPYCQKIIKWSKVRKQSKENWIQQRASQLEQNQTEKVKRQLKKHSQKLRTMPSRSVKKVTPNDKTIKKSTGSRNLKKVAANEYKTLYRNLFGADGKSSGDENPQEKRYLIFTATNPPDIRTRETHYQSYIVDFNYNIIHIFDPAKAKKGKSIYTGYITNSIMKLFQDKNTEFILQHEFVKNATPQKTTKDTFCQSWSLWMIIHFMNGEFSLQNDQKYKIFYNFYKEVVKIKSVCDYVKEHKETGNNCHLPSIHSEQEAKFYLLDNFNV